MKFYCRIDGVHFPHEYEETLKPPCNFWGDMGFANLADDLKRKFWDWLFSCPSDEIAVSSKIAISINIQTGAIADSDKFEKKVKGYNNLTEHGKQLLQKEFFQRKHRGEDVEAWIRSLDIQPDEERLKN